MTSLSLAIALSIGLDEPAKFSAAFKKKTAKPGDEVELVVTAKIEPGWHIYAVDKPTGVSVKTQLKPTFPKGLSAAGEWKIPAPKKDDHASEETYIYEGEVKFARKLKLAKDATGKLEAKVDVSFMACDENMCLPPKKVTLKATVEVEAKK
jgi:thiol:disulfide interchange protein DsbD